MSRFWSVVWTNWKEVFGIFIDIHADTSYPDAYWRFSDFAGSKWHWVLEPDLNQSILLTLQDDLKSQHGVG